MTVKPRVMIAAAVVLAIAAGAATLAAAPSSQTQAAVADRTAPGTIGAGISIGAHWVIDVKNRDGSVASTTEFDNAFIGAIPLAKIFAGEIYLLKWEVSLDGTCPIGETYCPYKYLGEDFGLTTRSQGGNFVLTGTAPAGTPLLINDVRTTVLECHAADGTPLFPSPTVPGDPTMTGRRGFCIPPGFPFYAPGAGLGFWNFSHKVLATPITVYAGQEVTVTITMSFTAVPHP